MTSKIISRKALQDDASTQVPFILGTLAAVDVLKSQLLGRTIMLTVRLNTVARCNRVASFLAS